VAEDSYIVSDRRYAITGQWLREMFLTAYRAGQAYGARAGALPNVEVEDEKWQEFAGWKTACGEMPEEAPVDGRKKAPPLGK